MMMSDGSLSQAEIDALLQSNNEDTVAVAAPTPTPPPAPPVAPSMPSEPNTDIGAIKTMLEQAVSPTAEIIKGLVNATCTLTLIKSEALDFASLQNELGFQVVQIKHMITNLSEGGELLHLLSEEAAVRLASSIIGQDDLTVDDLVLNALQEAFSQIGEPFLQQAGGHRGGAIEVSAGEAVQMESSALAVSGAVPVLNTYQLSLEKEKITFYQIFDQTLFGSINTTQVSSEPVATPLSPQPGFAPAALASAPAMPMSAPVVPAPTPVGGGGAWGGGAVGAAPSPVVHPVTLNDFGSHVNATHHSSLELLMDVDMQLTVELGQTRKQVREILQLGEGSIVELDKLAGEPVDVKVNQQLIAKGEVVVIDENFGVRITEIVSPADRIRNVG